MSQPDPRQALIRLLATQSHSLPIYVVDARPWVPPGEEAALDALHQIAADQQQMATRIAEHMSQRYGQIDAGEFPMEYTSVHDLSVDFLIRKAIAAQKRDVSTIERCVTDLEADPPGRALAEEALGAARGHLETLEELVAQHR